MFGGELRVCLYSFKNTISQETMIYARPHVIVKLADRPVKSIRVKSRLFNRKRVGVWTTIDIWDELTVSVVRRAAWLMILLMFIMTRTLLERETLINLRIEAF
jgi:hypothetical protein